MKRAQVPAREEAVLPPKDQCAKAFPLGLIEESALGGISSATLASIGSIGGATAAALRRVLMSLQTGLCGDSSRFAPECASMLAPPNRTSSDSAALTG